MPRAFIKATLLFAAAAAGGCLAHQTAALQRLSAQRLACRPPDIQVGAARTALGATLWRASCDGEAFTCAARHNFDGPVQLVCHPEAAAR